MPSKDKLNAMNDTKNSLRALKPEAESDEMQLDTAEHKRLLALHNQRQHEQGRRMAPCPIGQRSLSGRGIGCRADANAPSARLVSGSMEMKKNRRYHYLTTDSGNAATAEALAVRRGLELEIVEPRDLPRMEREQANVIIDSDFLPADLQSYLINGMEVQVVAIHGYNLSDSVASFLPRRGIVCGRRLDEQFFRELVESSSAA
jgi:hypothetical protein